MFGLGNEEVLKGEAPYGKEYKARQKARPIKQKIYDWYKDYCQDHHWDRDLLFKMRTDLDGESEIQPSLKLFAYNIWKNFLGLTFFFNVRMLFQKLFRKDHICNRELWSLDWTLAKKILPYLHRFKHQKRMGYPSYFSEYNENEWHSREEYDLAIANGKMEGGGDAAWEKVLDKIIMAFEFKVYDGNDKKEREWYLKYFGMDPMEKYECNKHESFNYRNIDERKGIASTMTGKAPDLDKVEWCIKSTSYHNFELSHYAGECVQYGFELFGKFYQNLWD